MNEDTQIPGYRLPPVDLLAMVSLGLIVIGGIFMASNVPKTPSLVLPWTLFAVSAAIFVWNMYSLRILDKSERARFVQYGKWGLLAYIIEGGFLMYVFISDGVRGGSLAVLLGMLALFMLNVPLLIAFTVVKFNGGAPQAQTEPASS